MQEKRTNKVHIAGYLKENTLEVIQNPKDGTEAIRGALIVAVDDINSHKVQFFINSKTKTGEDSKDFEALKVLLPNLEDPNAPVSIASYLKTHENADFATASNASTKVWVNGRFDEFCSRVGERERSGISIKGFSAGIITADSHFDPRAVFDLDVYIDDLNPEIDAEGKQTGRATLNAIYVDFAGCAHKIGLIAPAQDGIANYILNNYHETDTVALKGDVVSIQERKLINNSSDSEFFGRSAAPQYETTFIRERRIMGGQKTPLSVGSEGSYTTEEIKNALASRELKMEKTGKRALSKPTPSAESPQGFVDAPSKASTSATTDVDLDF